MANEDRSVRLNGDDAARRPTALHRRRSASPLRRQARLAPSSEKQCRSFARDRPRGHCRPKTGVETLAFFFFFFFSKVLTTRGALSVVLDNAVNSHKSAVGDVDTRLDRHAHRSACEKSSKNRIFLGHSRLCMRGVRVTSRGTLRPQFSVSIEIKHIVMDSKHTHVASRLRTTSRRNFLSGQKLTIFRSFLWSGSRWRNDKCWRNIDPRIATYVMR